MKRIVRLTLFTFVLILSLFANVIINKNNSISAKTIINSSFIIHGIYSSSG